MEKFFSKYLKVLGHENEYADNSGSKNHKGIIKEPPPSPSSDSSHHFNCDSRHMSKKPFLKVDVKFDLAMYAEECNAENLNNWIKYIEVYYRI